MVIELLVWREWRVGRYKQWASASALLLYPIESSDVDQWWVFLRSPLRCSVMNIVCSWFVRVYLLSHWSLSTNHKVSYKITSINEVGPLLRISLSLSNCILAGSYPKYLQCITGHVQAVTALKTVISDWVVVMRGRRQCRRITPNHAVPGKIINGSSSWYQSIIREDIHERWKAVNGKSPSGDVW